MGGDNLQLTAKQLGVLVVAYCPLNSWPSKMAPVHDVHVAHIAARLGITPAMVLLRWGVDQGIAVLTRSHDSIRLHQALQVEHEQLSLHDMSILSGLAHFFASPHNRPPKPDGMEEQDFFGIEKLRDSSLNFLADKEL